MAVGRVSFRGPQPSKVFATSAPERQHPKFLSSSGVLGRSCMRVSQEEIRTNYPIPALRPTPTRMSVRNGQHCACKLTLRRNLQSVAASQSGEGELPNLAVEAHQSFDGKYRSGTLYHSTVSGYTVVLHLVIRQLSGISRLRNLAPRAQVDAHSLPHSFLLVLRQLGEHL